MRCHRKPLVWCSGRIGGIEWVWPAVIGFGDPLGFHDEAAAFVEVDEVGGAFDVAVVEPDGFVVDVNVVALVLAGGVGARDGQPVAQLVAEGLEVGPLGGGRGVPAVDEVFDGRCDATIMGRTGALAPHAGGKAERRPGLDWRWVRAREQWQRTQSGGGADALPPA